FEEPAFALVMGSPRIPLSDKAGIVRQRLSSLHPTALNLAVLLISKGRHELAPNLVDEYRRLWDAHRGIEHARVITAVTLTREEEESVARRLSETTGKQIQLETSVDPTIIAGIVIRLGDKIIDGSTRGQLQALKRSLSRV
ncbi:MAG: atpH, partial [Dehalococcoidia bacterium]|nr:atpH [Dehalococcoidia bacterium]